MLQQLHISCVSAGLSLQELPALKIVDLKNCGLKGMGCSWPLPPIEEICSVESMTTNFTLPWLVESSMFQILSKLETLAVAYDETFITASHSLEPQSAVTASTILTPLYEQDLSAVLWTIKYDFQRSLKRIEACNSEYGKLFHRCTRASWALLAMYEFVWTLCA